MKKIIAFQAGCNIDIGTYNIDPVNDHSPCFGPRLGHGGGRRFLFPRRYEPTQYYSRLFFLSSRNQGNSTSNVKIIFYDLYWSTRHYLGSNKKYPVHQSKNNKPWKNILG